MAMIKIEVQGQFGRWQYYTSVTHNPINIRDGLNRAIKTQLASKSKKARAIDPKTGMLVDMLMG